MGGFEGKMERDQTVKQRDRKESKESSHQTRKSRKEEYTLGKMIKIKIGPFPEVK